MRRRQVTWILAIAAGVIGAPAAAQQTDISERPAFTPYTKKPELRSAAETAALLQALYPSQLREAGIGGTAMVWVFIERTGEVGKVQLNQSSGFEALDDAALRVAQEMEFTPARNRDRPVDVWVQIPVRFIAEQGGQQADRGAARAPAGTSGDITAAPTFTPYTVRPELANREEVAAALEASYPPVLRDAGISGTTNVWFLIGADGEVVKAQVAQSSGHDALDEAALKVAQTMEFHPARNREEAVMVWVQVPVRFASK